MSSVLVAAPVYSDWVKVRDLISNHGDGSGGSSEQHGSGGDSGGDPQETQGADSGSSGSETGSGSGSSTSSGSDSSGSDPDGSSNPDGNSNPWADGFAEGYARGFREGCGGHGDSGGSHEQILNLVANEPLTQLENIDEDHYQLISEVWGGFVEDGDTEPTIFGKANLPVVTMTTTDLYSNTEDLADYLLPAVDFALSQVGEEMNGKEVWVRAKFWAVSAPTPSP